MAPSYNISCFWAAKALLMRLGGLENCVQLQDLRMGTETCSVTETLRKKKKEIQAEKAWT